MRFLLKEKKASWLCFLQPDFGLAQTWLNYRKPIDMITNISRIKYFALVVVTLALLSMSPADESKKERFLVLHEGHGLCLTYKAAEQHIQEHKGKFNCKVVGYCTDKNDSKK